MATGLAGSQEPHYGMYNRPSMKPQPAYFPSVDILRGFAAISVVVYHVIIYWSWQSFPETGPLSWFRIGGFGVDLFFVISGFVIGLSAFTEIDRHGADGFRKPFWRRRVARILPLHYLTCLVYVVFISPELLFNKIWPNAISHLLFVHNLIPIWHGSINGVNWSLGAEMQFYVLMLLIAPWIRSGRVWQIALVLVGITWAWRFGAWYLMDPKDVERAFALWRVASELPGMLDEFAAGLLLARFVRSEPGRRFLEAAEAKKHLLLPVAGAVALLLWPLFTTYWAYSAFWFFPAMVTFFRTPVALACALLLLIACGLNGAGWLRITRPLRYLGTISYGIYLWHLPVLLSLKRINGLSAGNALALIVGLTTVFAAISWHFFEKPLIERYGRTKIPAMTPDAADVSQVEPTRLG
jgi:peptidoglycan/LPS O-acetylase OafA/YrhL